MKTNEQATNTALTSILDTIESYFIPQFKLLEIAIDPSFKKKNGSIRDTAIQLQSKKYISQHWRCVTLTTILDEKNNLLSVTLIALPSTKYCLPIVGLDAVSINKTWSLLACDQSPTDLSFWELHSRSIQQTLKEATAAYTKPRKIPTFALESFSPLPLISAVSPGSEQQAANAVSYWLKQICQLSTDCESTETTALVKAQNKWLSSELKNRKEHNALAMMFGDEFTSCFTEQHLFPFCSDDINIDITKGITPAQSNSIHPN